MLEETNRFGRPLESPALKDIVKDLLELPKDAVYALCAELILAHEPMTWKEIYQNLLRDTDAELS